MRRTAVNMDEAPLADRAGAWLDKIEAALDANGLDHRHPQARTLQRMDQQLAEWRRGIRAGRHDAATLQAERQVLTWLHALEHALVWSHYDRKAGRVTLR